MTARPTLGVVAISYNEEKDLPGFLDHLLPWVDEIILVDDGSTDGTVALARAAGSKVHVLNAPRQAEEGYADQRNKGIAGATCEWLLHMDIDERVTPELAKEILKAISDPSKDGFRYRRLNFSLHRPHRGYGWRVWNNMQLARAQARFVGKVHERCVLDSDEIRIGQLEGYMWHLKEASYPERIQKNFTYMQLEADKLLSSRRKIRWFDFFLHPAWRTFKFYFLNGGWRDGTVGVLDAMFVLTATFNWYATAWDRANSIPRPKLEAQLRDLWAACERSRA